MLVSIDLGILYITMTDTSLQTSSQLRWLRAPHPAQALSSSP